MPRIFGNRAKPRIQKHAKRNSKRQDVGHAQRLGVRNAGRVRQNNRESADHRDLPGHSRRVQSRECDIASLAVVNPDIESSINQAADTDALH